jgi:hypothetical protein
MIDQNKVRTDCEAKLAHDAVEGARMSTRFADLSKLLADFIIKKIEPTAGVLDFDLHAIRSSAYPFEWPVICGVYFLFSGGSLVYIGQSVNVHTRLQQHKLAKGMDYFDAVAVLPLEKRLLDVVESWYYHRLAPRDGGRPPITKLANIEKRIVELEMPEIIKQFLIIAKTEQCAS